jgi:hypothetical protein
MEDRSIELVTHHVVDANQRFIEREGQCFRSVAANGQAASHTLD